MAWAEMAQTKPKCYMSYSPYVTPRARRVELGYLQYKAFTSIIRDFGLQKPLWVQDTFNITEIRANYIIELADQAGLGKNWCHTGTYRDDWCDFVHALFHESTHYLEVTSGK